MTRKPLPDEIARLLASVTNRRAKIVIDHILKHGFITTEELEKKYGYNHPPRAARDVREAGIPLETFRVQSSDGRWIAAYRFGDLTKLRRERLQGRQIFPREFKRQLYETGHHRCAICGGEFDERYLQVDHRVPYEVAGDMIAAELDPDQYMLVCGSCNRAKPWSCEHCANWIDEKSPQVCLKCYWGNPTDYAHIALREIRRADILWTEGEVQIYDHLRRFAVANRTPLPDYVKRTVAKFLEDGEDM